MEKFKPKPKDTQLEIKLGDEQQVSNTEPKFFDWEKILKQLKRTYYFADLNDIGYDGQNFVVNEEKMNQDELNKYAEKLHDKALSSLDDVTDKKDIYDPDKYNKAIGKMRAVKMTEDEINKTQRLDNLK